MGTARKNPFRPGAGKVPPHRAGHEVAVRKLAGWLDLLVTERAGDMVILYGPRGNGKTALLAELYGMAEEHKVRIGELDTGLMTGDPEKLAEMLEPMEKLPIPKIAGLTIKVPGLVEAGVKFTTSEATPLGNMLLSLLRGPLVLMIDEAHDMPPKDGKVLLQISQRFIRHGLPLLLVLAGTPGIRPSLRRIGASFWERARRLKIGRLETRDAVREALSIPMGRSGLSVAKGALEMLVDESQSYPFFIQFLGEQTWEAAMERDPATSRIKLEDAQAGVRLAAELRGDFYKERRDEAKTRKILPEAEAVSKAFFDLGGDGTLSEARLEDVVRPVLSGGRTVDDAIEVLSALGLVWESKESVWEQGIPSLCTYLAERARS